MGEITVIGGIKGGNGKTTIAVNLAIVAAQRGRTVMAVDGDAEQGNLSDFFKIRSRKPHDGKVVACRDSGDMHDLLLELKERYDDVIVDCGGFDSAELRSAILVADHWIIPLCPTQYQTWTMEKVRTLLVQSNQTRGSVRGPLVGQILGTRLSVNRGTLKRQVELLAGMVSHVNDPDFEVLSDKAAQALRNVATEMRRFALIPETVSERDCWVEAENDKIGVVELVVGDKRRAQVVEKARTEIIGVYNHVMSKSRAEAA
jgi:cellulose biosynthesis protein BcsQ